MKKEIVYNDAYYETKYTISKKKWAVYYINKKINDKYLVFYRNAHRHRFCNLGPQFRDNYLIEYVENDKTHNLYGPAFIDKIDNTKKYIINFVVYTKSQFSNYISIYNNLSYKRTYL